MAYPVTLNGRTYTLADFEGTNYVEGLPDAFEDFVTHAGDIYNSTSTTSNTIGTGSKTFTVESAKPYQAGTPLRIADAAAPSTNFIDAIVTSYSGTTLVVDSVGYAGSGTFTSWNVNIGGSASVAGTVAIAQGGTGATTAAAARTNLDVYSKADADSRFLNVSGEASDVTMTGNVTIGDASGDTLTVNATADFNTGFNVDGTITSDGLTVGAAVVVADVSTGGSTPFFKVKRGTTNQSNLVASFHNDNNAGIDVHGNGDISFYEDTGTTAKFFWDASAEKLGLGTTSPDDPITIQASSGMIKMIDAQNTNVYHRIYSASDSSLTISADAGNANSGQLRFFTADTQRMSIDKDGFVGIGITPSDWRTQFDDNALDVGNHSAIYDQWGGATFIANNFYRENNNAFIYKTSNDASFLQMDGGNITFGNAPNGTAGATATFSERMRINGSGNIGINESSPDTKLHVSNTASQTPIATIENTASHEASIRFKTAHSAASDFRVGASISASNNFEIYSVAAATPRLTIDSSGNVGINRTSQDGVLLDAEAASTGNIYGLRIRNRGQSAGSAVSAIWSLNRDGSDVNFPAASIKAIKEQNWTTNASTIDGAMVFETISDESSTEKMRISSGGSVLIGTTAWSSTSNGIYFGPSSNSRILITNSTDFGIELYGATTSRMSFYSSAGGSSRVGTITVSTSSTSYNTSSDYRLKENVVELTGATDRLKQLEPKRFNFIADADTTVDGFLAHEVESVVPEAITGTHNEVDDEGNPVYQGIDQSKLVPLLVATIKELEARITALESN